MKVANLQQQMNELRELVLQLSKDINSIQLELNYLSNSKYGKGI
jgi:hypothetical protein